MNPRTGTALAAALVVGLVGWLILRDGGDTHPAAPTTPAAPAVKRSAAVATGRAQLLALASTKRPIYWAGPAGNHVLEMVRAGDGSVYLRYLTPGTPLGAAAQNWLTVVTYPSADPLATARQGAARPGAIVHHLPGGALSVSPPGRPTNVFLGVPGAKVLVEVYDPNPRRAQAAVLSGRVKPVS